MRVSDFEGRQFKIRLDPPDFILEDQWFSSPCRSVIYGKVLIHFRQCQKTGEVYGLEVVWIVTSFRNDFFVFWIRGVVSICREQVGY